MVIWKNFQRIKSRQEIFRELECRCVSAIGLVALEGCNMLIFKGLG